jgi:hypothetical protein
MPRYLFRVQYTIGAGPDAVGVDGAKDSVTYEPVAVDAATEAAARTAVEAATDRYKAAVNATRTLTLVTTV